MSYINESLLKFPQGLHLYMKRDGNMLNGITLRKIECLKSVCEPGTSTANPVFVRKIVVEPRFDVTAEDSDKQRNSIHHQHLDNYFNCYALYLTRYRNAPLLESLFVAQGKYAHYSLQDILNKTNEWFASDAGSPLNVFDTKLNTTSTTTAEEKATAVSPEEVLERLRAKHTVLLAEYRLLSNIEAQLQINQNLTNGIARKRKILENPECQ